MIDMKILIAKTDGWRYGQRECTVVKNGQVKNYNFITLNNVNTNEFEVSEFTDFFSHRDRLNNSIHTNKNNYGTILVLFLNYIFIDREEVLTSIEDITIEIGSEFLNKYTYGYIGRKLKSGNENKSDDVVQRAEASLSIFYSWLYYQRSKYKLKFIKKTDFTYENKQYKGKNGKFIKEYKFLKSLFTVEYPHKLSKRKLQSPDELMIYTLIEIARQYDPMMAFPIALQSFAGLRRGEVCQMTRERITNRKPYGETISFYIDLRREYMMRSDGVRTGEIKRPRIQLVYEAFLPYISYLYMEHMALLRQKGLDKDEYGALFFGNNNKALKTDRYASRFNNLVLELIKRLGQMADEGNTIAAVNYEMLLDAKMTPHSLRYFFTEYLAKRENTHNLAMYRGDANLNTALLYLSKSRGKTEYIREIQNSFAGTFEKMMGKPFTGDYNDKI